MKRIRLLQSLGCPLRSLACLSLVLAGSWGIARAEEPADTAAEPRAKYLRITRDTDDEPIALQTAIVHFAPADAAG